MNEENQCRVVGWLITAIAIGLLAVVAFTNSGCMQTMHGMASDIRSGATYVEDHTIDDK